MNNNTDEAFVFGLFLFLSFLLFLPLLSRVPLRRWVFPSPFLFYPVPLRSLSLPVLFLFPFLSGYVVNLGHN
jgi:hypothetical protein